MTRNIYALLVGIDNYPAPVASLRGCVNDVVAIAAYLRGRVAQDGFELHLHILKNQEATRQAVINGFRQHLCQANSQDVAFFYYSGHGSQELAPPEFWHLEPDRLNETLVCWDSRLPGGWDLADKELAKLIAEVAAKQPHISIIMDCCHSGAGTRDALEAATRWTPADDRLRPLDTFIFSRDEFASLTAATDPEKNPTGWNLPIGRHVLLAACRDHEKAREFYSNGEHRGAFCYFLLDTLQKANGSLTYRDLYKRTNAIIRSKLPAQSPQLEATSLEDLDQPFLGGAIAPHTPYFTVFYHNDYGWVMDGGAVHGIPQPVDRETTRLVLFPFDCATEQLRQFAQKVAEAEVVRVLPQLSVLNLVNQPESFNQELTFKAIVTSIPLPPLKVCLIGDEAGIRLVHQTLQTVAPGRKSSLYIKAVDQTEACDLRLFAQNGEYVITGSVDDRPLVDQLEGYTSQNAAQVVQRLEHIARWTTIAELSSPGSSQIPPDAVQIQIFQGDEELQQAREIVEPHIRLSYQYDSTTQQWKEPRFRIKLKNTSDRPLYCALLDLTERYSITAGLFATGGIWLRPRGEMGDEAWAASGKSLFGIVPKELYQRGVTEYKDILKLIVSTNEFDATLLEQEKLDLPTTRSIQSATPGKGTLNRLMRRVMTRDLLSASEEEACDDWVTSQVTFTIVRPLNVASVSATAPVSLGAGVMLHPHPDLHAQARLTTMTQSTRDLGNLILPPILRADPTISQPFQFTTSRGTDPGLSALELQVSDAEAKTLTSVTPESPLKLTVDTPLEAGEHLLPLAFDGEFFLPLGSGLTKDGRTEIRLERLPDPVNQGEKSLGGSIRIFFQKLVAEKLGLEFPYPILAAAEFEQDGTIRPEGDVEKIKQKVISANKIAVCIHGLIGNTRSMVASVQQPIEVDGQQQSIASFYDLILTFDYENINTSIEENARSLKQRLAAVGLGENHGKTLHIIAHSTGGLVSRWLIEREGGNKIIQHLVMLGTPNAGSPWSTVQEWAIPALAFGLNSLSTVALPIKVLATLLTAIETVDVVLDQMQPGSDFLKSLAASPDPGIPYTILAGNTSIIQPLTETETERINRLIRKLVRGAVEFPFFGQPNDMVATVYSIKNIPTGRSQPPHVQEVACDHLVYLTHPAGLAALVKTLAAIPVPTSQTSTSSTGASVSVAQSPLQENPTSTQEHLPQSLEHQPGQPKRQWLNGFIVGLVVALLTIAGFWLWQRSQNPKPTTPDNPNQSSIF